MGTVSKWHYEYSGIWGRGVNTVWLHEMAGEVAELWDLGSWFMKYTDVSGSNSCDITRMRRLGGEHLGNVAHG